jgi:hypothetical protein
MRTAWGLRMTVQTQLLQLATMNTAHQEFDKRRHRL